MTRDLRRAHRVVWWLLPLLMAGLLLSAWMVRESATRSLTQDSPPSQERAP